MLCLNTLNSELNLYKVCQLFFFPSERDGETHISSGEIKYEPKDENIEVLLFLEELFNNKKQKKKIFWAC